MFKQLDKLSKFLYLGTLIPLFLSLITPLLVNSNFLFPFITTKTLFFRILIEISLFFYILLTLQRSEFRPRFTPLMKAVFVFFGVITLTSLFGVDLYKSFWGNIERGEGLLTLYHVLAFFFLLTQILRSKKLFQWFLHGTIFVSVLTAVYALFQFFGSDAVIHSGASRLSATIGNAAFYAGYLLINILLSFWFFLILKKKPWRIYYGLVIVFELFILIETETRGAFLGLVTAIILMSLFFAFSKNNQHSGRKKIALTVIALIILSAGIVFWQKDSVFVQRVGILHRMTTISFNDVTTQSRLLTWDSSWQGLKDRPLLGYGWENYNVAFNKYFHPEIFRDSGSQIWFDRAHNIIFDIAVSSGIIGLIAYFAIFIYAILALVRYARVFKTKSTAIVIVGLLAAYGVQNIFVFDVLATYISFYIILALVVWCEFEVQQKQHFTAQNTPSITQSAESSHQQHSQLSNAQNRLFPVIVAFSFVLLILSVFYFNIRVAQANVFGVKALIFSKLKQHQLASQKFQDSIDLNTNQTPEVRQRYAEFAIGLSREVTDQAFISREFSKAITEMKKNVRSRPYDVQHALFLMILYNRSDQFNPQRRDLVLSLGESALELSPTRPQIYFEIGQAYMSKGKFDQGITAFQTALALQPNALESHWNLTAAYYIAGQFEKGDQAFDALKELGYDYYAPHNLQRFVSVLTQAGNWEKIVDIYFDLVEMEPENLDYLSQLALAYREVGDKDKARTTALRVSAIDSSRKAEVDDFIQSMGQEGPIENSAEIEELRGE